MTNKKLQYIAKDIMECDDGWLEPVQSIVDFINWHNSCSENQVEILQVKEKFGRLEVYTHGSCPGLDDAKHFAKELASNTCEICGSKENVGFKQTDWLMTVCKKCAQDIANRNNKEVKWIGNNSKDSEIIKPVKT